MALKIVETVRNGHLYIAHRGARSLAPENTLASGRKALELGAGMWEIDVRMSRDGKPVVAHDATLERTSDAKVLYPERKPWNVHDFTLAELKSLDFGSWFARSDPFRQVAAGAVSAGELRRYESERIPTLEEALEFTLRNDWLVNVELKDLSGCIGHREIAAITAGLVSSLSAVGNVLVSSFNLDYLAEIKRIDASIRTGVLIEHVLTDPVDLVRRLDAFTFHPAMRAFSTKHLGKMIELGCHTLVWVVNNRNIAGSLMKNGASGVFTDFPQSIRPARCR